MPDVSLEQLIALNDEIASLVRAGIPLEAGLQERGRDLPERLSEISFRLATRMSQGETLAAALGAEGNRFPPSYRIIVEAGLKAGRLSAVLEAHSSFARSLLELRRRIGLAFLYPLIVVALAYGLFLVFLLEMVERWRTAYDSFRIPIHGGLQLLLQLRDSIAYWGWILPVCLVVLVVWWVATGGADSLNFSGPGAPLGWIPGMKKFGRHFRLANFSGLMALLVEQQVPLKEGIVLAAEATGDRELQLSATQLAADLERGHSLREHVGGGAAFPPFLRWLLGRGSEQGPLGPALHQASAMYRRRAESEAEWFKFLMPVLAGLVIGGGATLAYTLALFVPLSQLWQDLAQ